MVANDEVLHHRLAGHHPVVHAVKVRPSAAALGRERAIIDRLAPGGPAGLAGNQATGDGVPALCRRDPGRGAVVQVARSLIRLDAVPAGRERASSLVRSLRQHGSQDARVLAHGGRTRRILLTMDTDFGTLVFVARRRPPPEIVPFRLAANDLVDWLGTVIAALHRVSWYRQVSSLRALSQELTR
ncbi:MAG: DUF5615 family PIN-like protein [Geminicoccaceae bacterium]